MKIVLKGCGLSFKKSPKTYEFEYNSEELTLMDGKFPSRVGVYTEGSSYKSYYFKADADGKLYVKVAGNKSVFRIMTVNGTEGGGVINFTSANNYGDVDASKASPLPTESAKFNVSKDEYILICATVSNTNFDVVFEHNA